MDFFCTLFGDLSFDTKTKPHRGIVVGGGKDEITMLTWVCQIGFWYHWSKIRVIAQPMALLYWWRFNANIWYCICETRHIWHCFTGSFLFRRNRFAYLISHLTDFMYVSSTLQIPFNITRSLDFIVQRRSRQWPRLHDACVLSFQYFQCVAKAS